MNRFFTQLGIILTLTAPSLSAIGQARPVTVELSPFSLPPAPVEVLDLQLHAGELTFFTWMPLSGRPVPAGTTVTVKGAVFEPTGALLHRRTLDAAGGLASQQNEVFSALKPAAPTEGPLEWQVLGTRPADDPQRFPFGGDWSTYANRYPQLPQPSRKALQMHLGNAGGSVFPKYLYQVTALNPATGRLQLRPEEADFRQGPSAARLTGFQGATTGGVEKDGAVLRLQPDPAAPVQFEAVVHRLPQGEQVPSMREAALLRFDDKGTLLHALPIQFAYNRTLLARTPLIDPQGRMVGTFTVFADGGVKKTPATRKQTASRSLSPTRPAMCGRSSNGPTAPAAAVPCCRSTPCGGATPCWSTTTTSRSCSNQCRSPGLFRAAASPGWYRAFPTTTFMMYRCPLGWETNGRLAGTTFWGATT